MSKTVNCVSCRTDITINDNFALSDFYCPECGERMKLVNGEPDFYINYFANPVRKPLSPREQLLEYMRLGQWDKADPLSRRIIKNVDNKDDLILIGEIRYHYYRSIPNVGHAYIFLMTAFVGNSSVGETRDYYVRDLLAFGSLLGIYDFDARAVHELIERCKPEDQDFESFASHFCASAMFAGKRAKRLRLMRKNRHVRRDIMAFAEENKFDILSDIPRAWLWSLL